MNHTSHATPKSRQRSRGEGDDTLEGDGVAALSPEKRPRTEVFTGGGWGSTAKLKDQSDGHYMIKPEMKTGQGETTEMVLDPETRSIPMMLFLDPLGHAVHRNILRQNCRALWDKLRDIDLPQSAGTLKQISVEDITKHERALHTRHSSLALSGADLSKVLQMYESALGERQFHPVIAIKDSSSDKHSSTSNPTDDAMANGEGERSSQRRRSSGGADDQHSGGQSKRSHRIDAPSNNKASRIGGLSSTVKAVAGLKRTCVLDEVMAKHKQRPVIVVPSGASVLVNENNIFEFLQYGRFVDSNANPAVKPTKILQDGRSSQAGLDGADVASQHSGSKFLSREIRGKTVKFRIVESAKALKFEPSEWYAVVAVIVRGPEWQFKGWPFQSVEDIFKTFRGFYFAYTEVPVPPNLHQWKVQVMRLSRTQRHYDGPMQNEFWRLMEEFLLSPRDCRVSKSCPGFLTQG